MWKCSKCKKEFSIFKPSSVINNLCVECFTKSFKFAAQYLDAYGKKSFDKWKAQIEREARISELKRMWDENTNLCVLDKDDTVATLTLKLGKTNQIIAKRIKELESE